MNIYEVKDLGTLNGDRPDARAINNAGVVVGRIGNHAMRYDGSLKILPTPLIASPAGQPATEKYVAWGINNGNPELIVGFREVNNFRYATMWVDGAYVDLHASLDANFSEAYDVNDNGVVVGRADFQAFRFDTNAGPDQPKFVQLLTADNVASCAKAINAQGHVVGWLDTYHNGFPISVAFIYDNGLSVLPDTYGESLRVLHDDLLDINDGNIVVGRIVPSDGAFQYDHNTKATTNITPEIPYPNQIHAAAQANNKYNRVVGKKWGGAEGLEYVGVVWNPGEPMQNLFDWIYPIPYGLSITEAVAINTKNEIVVHGQYGGESPGSFLLEPVYEPRPYKNPYDHLEWLVQVVLFGGGGSGVLAPSGRRIFPKGPPVDPSGPFRRLDPAQRDVLVGLAVQVLAKNISDSEARRIAESGGLQAIRRAVDRLSPGV